MDKIILCLIIILLCISCVEKNKKSEEIDSDNKKLNYNVQLPPPEKKNTKGAIEQKESINQLKQVFFTEKNIFDDKYFLFDGKKVVDKKIGFSFKLPDSVILEYNPKSRLFLDMEKENKHFLTLKKRKVDFSDSGFQYSIDASTIKEYKDKIKNNKITNLLWYNNERIGEYQIVFNDASYGRLVFSFIKNGFYIFGSLEFMTNKVMPAIQKLEYLKDTEFYWKGGGKALTERIKAGDPEIPKEIANTYKYFMQIVDSLEFFEPEPVNEDTKAQKNTEEQP